MSTITKEPKMAKPESAKAVCERESIKRTSMEKIKILIVCIHNAARSQIAEAFLKSMAGDKFEVYSAGLEPTTINPLAIEIMKEVGIDISGNKTKKVFDFYKQGKIFHYVISVCEEARQRCPIFPGLLVKNIHWDFEDPAEFQGPYEEKIKKMRILRDQIKLKVEEFIKQTQ
jgi:arsenate reductase